MRWLAPLVLLFALTASAQEYNAPSSPHPRCTLVADITFTSATDPFTGGVWGSYPGTADVNCPVRWDDTADSIEREVIISVGCSNLRGLARYNTDIGTPSVAVAVHAKALDPGTGTNPFKFPGLVLRNQTGTLSTSGHYQASCEDGLPCDAFNWTIGTGTTITGTSTCTTFGAAVAPGWIGAILLDRGSASDRLEAFNMGEGIVPGDPRTWAKVFGAPECVFNGFPTGGSVDQVGSRVGFALGTNTVAVGGSAQYDRLMAWACRP